MIGRKLAHYEILDLLGKGGMGEVYRARDAKLGREVALKILPRELSGDPERAARFEREARTLASLQHPNVASIYGFEEEAGIRFLVMELCEGQDLSRRLAQGALTVDEAIHVAAQVAAGLEAAHEKGIVHRDLKPANLVLDADGQVKILDFGLARAWYGDGLEDSDPATSPTITAAMTQAGTILGTAAYMSPEQARGRRVDQRADLWAFGVILWQMLSGRPLFEGETISDTLAAVLRAEPDWQDLPRETPPNLRRLLKRCLARDPRERLRSAADARLELLDREEPSVVAPARGRSPWMPGALVLLAAAVLGAGFLLRPSTPESGERPPTHLSLTLPEGLQVASRDKLPLGAPQPCVAISDDGRLVVVVVERDDTTWLYRRFLDEPAGELLEDTRDGYFPRIAPNGKWMSFMAGNALMRMETRGERATRLLELPNSFGHEWLNDREIVINRSEATELLRVDAERGTFTAFERQSVRDEYFWPRRVPGHDLLLFNSDSHVAKSEEADVDQVSLMDLRSGERTVLGLGGSMPQPLPDGALLLVRDGVLTASPFDPLAPDRTVRTTTVLDGMLVEGWIGQFAVSANGVLVYVPGEWLIGTELVWDDGRGDITPLGFPLLAHGDFELSPDGRQLAITVGGGSDTQAWVYDLERGARSLLTTDGPGWSPVWSPDGTQLAYAAPRGDGQALYLRTLGSNAPPELLLEGETRLSPYAWHPETGILCSVGHDIHRVDPERPGESRPLVTTEASEWGPDLSPDGRWMAYTSDESGRYEIYVRAIEGERAWPVSLEGGEEPIFSADGTTLYHRYGNRFFATPILEASEDGTRFRAGQPRVVVEGAYSNVPGFSYDVHPDGRLLLLRTDGGTERPGHLDVILDWDVELAEKMAPLR